MQSDYSNNRMNPIQGGRQDIQETPAGNPPQGASEPDLQELLPDLYNRIKPHIDAIARELRNMGITDDMMDLIIQDIMNSEGPPEYEEGPQDELGPAVPAIRNFGRPGYPVRPIPYRRGWWYPGYLGGLSSDTLIRLLLLQRLGGFYF